MSVDFIPDPTYVRQIRPPYTSYWLGPFGWVAGSSIASLVLAAWLWKRAEAFDNNRPEF